MKLVNVNRPAYYNNPVDVLLKDFFNPKTATDRYEKEELKYTPSTNVFETDTDIALELLVPGYSKDEIKLSVENNMLLIDSQEIEPKADEKEAEELRYSRIEFEKKNFEKKFRLSEKLNQDQIKAEVNNGVLRITIAKKEEAVPVKRQIEIG
ncbi:Hsp20/alpha crystallin family protein [uncultured Sunxiuqinia sp.]|uniref:Hsp20/alpha crystallin family protein n=1 Tax=uncultured Sunxiuqinia sp. TaxID=1573825 RepID=UPI002AA75F1A|nr:Hsp20/alpha crystallin family protein [uncultured Sunxiuqinia sp.]